MWVGNDTEVDVMVRSEEIPRLSRYLRQKDLQYNVVIEDLQRAIDEENPSLSEQQMEELEGRKGLQCSPSSFPFVDHHKFLCASYFTLSMLGAFHFIPEFRKIIALIYDCNALTIDSAYHRQTKLSADAFDSETLFHLSFSRSTDTNGSAKTTRLKHYRVVESRREESREQMGIHTESSIRK